MNLQDIFINYANCDHMEFVAPSSIPLLVSEDLCQSIANKFAFDILILFLFYFDINRNVLRQIILNH